ncbi:MAG: cupin domain-containing protein [Planctomycetes bacterium]|nr:cupin domain-containing protein [Planctomycetota bacterium]
MSEKVLIIELNDKAEYQRILAGQPQTRGMRSGRVYIEPGQSCGQHSTKHHEELLVFLSGRGELLIGMEDSFQIGQGKVCYIPPNTVHDVKNTGTEPLFYIYCVAPASGESGQ